MNSLLDWALLLEIVISGLTFGVTHGQDNFIIRIYLSVIMLVPANLWSSNNSVQTFYLGSLYNKQYCCVTMPLEEWLDTFPSIAVGGITVQ